jgi:hypothetical protein
MLKVIRVTLVVLIVLVQTVHAQDAGKTIKNFRVLLKSGERHEGTNGRLTETGLEWMKKGEMITVPREEIRLLDEATGSKAKKYAVFGAGIGLSTALLAAILAAADTSDDPYTEFNTGAAIGISVGFTVAGGLIGAAIGASQKTWERVPIKTSFHYERHSKHGVCVLTIPF